MKHFIVIHLLISCFFYSISINATESDDINDDNEIEVTQIINGQVAIFLEHDAQINSGLKTLTLKETHYQPELTAYGQALSIAPLLETFNRYLTASAKQAGAKARFIQAKRNISRLRALHKNKAISTKKLQSQQSKWLSDKAIYNEMAYQSNLIINASRLEWGEKLTKWATSKQSDQFDQLMNNQATLLKVTLPAGTQLPNKTKQIQLSTTGDRTKTVSAEFISDLPQVNAYSQGLQYLFISNDSFIKTGMNFIAWIPHQQQAQTGIIIPQSALAWHLGVAFVFIKTEDDYFIHKNIADPIKIANGYFIAEQLAVGEELVIKGTQMLLSHEFKSQIPDEDDD